MRTLLVLRVNGVDHEVEADPRMTLLHVVREHIGLTGSKEGCSTGACGACTMIVDDRAVYSCLMLAGSAQGRSVSTIEGLAPPPTVHPLQQAFVDEGAIQCGFCIPGMIMAAKALLDEMPELTDDEIRHGLSGNYCRCTGYTKIVKAISTAAREFRK
jgi:carbon-monoxide dehydrogenase small subunit